MRPIDCASIVRYTAALWLYLPQNPQQLPETMRDKADSVSDHPQRRRNVPVTSFRNVIASATFPQRRMPCRCSNVAAWRVRWRFWKLPGAGNRSSPGTAPRSGFKTSRQASLLNFMAFAGTGAAGFFSRPPLPFMTLCCCQYYFVDAGKKVDYTKLFDKHLLEATTPLEQRYVLKRALDHLIACSEIDVMFAGVNDEGQTLYKRIV